MVYFYSGVDTCREIEAAGATVLAARLSYAGELGWELYAPVTEAGALSTTR